MSRNTGMPAAGSYAGETYYGRPAVKPSPFDWKIATYVFVAGVAGSAQIIAAMADRFGGRRAENVVRNGRYLALAGSLVGPPLLIADLKTPQRWYNMMRILRPTSPMSVGSFILVGFGAFSALIAAGHLVGERRGGRRSGLRRVGDLMQVPAAVAGAGMSVYTASLLTATSTPLWAGAPQALAVQFGTSSMATAAAALSLSEQIAGNQDNVRRLDTLAAVAAAGEAAASAVAESQYRAKGVAGALESGSWGAAHKIGGLALGLGVPLACHAINMVSKRPSRGLSILGSLALLAGGMVMRQAIFQAGNESAQRPADYFRFTQPEPPHDRRAAVPRWDRDRLGATEGKVHPIPEAATSAKDREVETITLGPRR